MVSIWCPSDVYVTMRLHTEPSVWINLLCRWRWRWTVVLPVTSLGNDLRTRYDDDDDVYMCMSMYSSNGVCSGFHYNQGSF